MTLKDEIWQTLRTIPYPGYSRDLVSFGMVTRVAECDGIVTVSLAIAHLAPEIKDRILKTVREMLGKNGNIRELELQVGEPTKLPGRTARAPTPRELPDIRHVIAVGSGKGGVGKSTVAANLAVALAQRGLSVGLMDADVYGPNLPRMLGVKALPPPVDGKIVPADAYQTKMVSIGLLVDPDQPILWRGPMTDKLINQFLSDVRWGALDVLVVDLPPGTGDIALSLVQHARPDGAVVVVTPQQVALDDARKAVGMFRKLGVNVLGVVENMSHFQCDGCNKRHYLFGKGGGLRFAEEMQLPLLGEVPLQPVVSDGGDQGCPVVLDASSQAGVALREVAERVWNALGTPAASVPLPAIRARVAA